VGDYDERDLRRRANAHIRATVGRLVWRRLLPVIALLAWLVIVSLPTRRVTLQVANSLTYLEITSQLKVVSTILLIGLLGALLWVEWRDRLVRQMRHEVFPNFEAKPKRDPLARLALDDDQLDELIGMGDEKPKRRSFD
jgi:hypothetical protein